jgi:putative peptidoglycan lipid II flippase
MLGMALSSIIGLASTVLVSRSFGTSAELDAFYAANRLTEIIFNLLAGGALASAFVPTFTEFLTQRDREGAWRLASGIVNIATLSLTLVAILVAIFAPWLVENILAPGFTDSAQISLTVDLLRLMISTSVIFGVSGLIMGVLNAQGHFALPALAPAFYRLGWIIGIGLLVPSMGIVGLAWGVVIGASMHLVIQIPGLLRRYLKYYPGFNLSNHSVRQVGRLMGPRMLGVAVVQVNFLVNTILASGQPEGSLAALSFALALMIMPQALIAQSTAIAALPTFSELVARGNLKLLQSTFAGTLRGVLFLSLPASLGLILLRKPLITFLFERGAFSSQSSEQVAWALFWYATGLIGHALLEIIVRAFYAMKDTRTPVLIGGLAMSLNVIFSLLFSSLFTQLGWAPHGGLALANSAATALEGILLLAILGRRFTDWNLSISIKGVGSMVIASAVMGFALYGWQVWLGGSPAWMTTLGGFILGLGVYLLASFGLGTIEPRSAMDILLRRVRQKNIDRSEK